MNTSVREHVQPSVPGHRLDLEYSCGSVYFGGSVHGLRRLSAAAPESVVRMTVGLAHELGLSTVAEGVTNGPTLDRLAAWGVDIAQGDHIGAPVAAGLVPGLLSGRGPITTMPSGGPGVAR